MTLPNGFRLATDLIYPPSAFGEILWKTGVDNLEWINIIQNTPQPLTEELLRQVIERWEALSSLLNEALDWWTSNEAPCFERTATSYVEAIFRRFERLGRFAFYAGSRFRVEPSFPPEGAWQLDYELASAFIHHRIESVDLSRAVAGLRREVVHNMSRPICRLSWERACVGEWRYRMWMEMLNAAPDYHWKLSQFALLKAIQALPQEGRELPRLLADPDTRTVSLDGREIASQLQPDLFAYVSAVIAAHPHPIPFRAICQNPGMGGKNQTRLRGKLRKECRRLHSLIETNNDGHFLKLPPRK